MRRTARLYFAPIIDLCGQLSGFLHLGIKFEAGIEIESGCFEILDVVERYGAPHQQPRLRPKLSQRLLNNKLKALTVDNPDRIVTANIGCQMHLETKAKVPVQHWIELLDA